MDHSCFVALLLFHQCSIVRSLLDEPHQGVTPVANGSRNASHDTSTIVPWSVSNATSSLGQDKSVMRMKPVTSLPQNATSVNRTVFHITNQTVISDSTSNSAVLTPLAPTAPDPCLGKTTWSKDFVVGCVSKSCQREMFDVFDLFIRCNERNQKQDILPMAEDMVSYALRLASVNASASIAASLPNTSTKVILHTFAMEHGFVNRDKSDILSTLSFSNTRQSSVDVIHLPKSALGIGITSYVWLYIPSAFDLNKATSIKFYKTVTEIDLENRGKVSSQNEEIKSYALNSALIILSLDPSPIELGNVVEMTFRHVELDSRKNPICVYLEGALSSASSYWSTKGCRRMATTTYWTRCRCDHLSAFALMSEMDVETVEEEASIRTRFTAFAVTFVTCACILVVIPLAVYHHYNCLIITHFEILFCFDCNLLIGYLAFLFGLVTHRNESLMPYTASVLSFCQLSTMTWLFAEGLNTYQEIAPFFNPKSVHPLFVFTTIAWGIPAAFSSASLGYPFDFSRQEEFVWIEASDGLIYFILLPIFILIAIAALFGFLLYELSQWIGARTDMLYKRSTQFMKRATASYPILLATWLLAVFARSSPDRSYLKYLFIFGYFSQALVAVTFHLIRNKELKDYISNKRKIEDAEKAKKKHQPETSHRFIPKATQRRPRPSIKQEQETVTQADPYREIQHVHYHDDDAETRKSDATSSSETDISGSEATNDDGNDDNSSFYTSDSDDETLTGESSSSAEEERSEEESNAESMQQEN